MQLFYVVIESHYCPQRATQAHRVAHTVRPITTDLQFKRSSFILLQVCSMTHLLHHDLIPQTVQVQGECKHTLCCHGDGLVSK